MKMMMTGFVMKYQINANDNLTLKIGFVWGMLDIHNFYMKYDENYSASQRHDEKTVSLAYLVCVSCVRKVPI